MLILGRITSSLHVIMSYIKQKWCFWFYFKVSFQTGLHHFFEWFWELESELLCFFELSASAKVEAEGICLLFRFCFPEILLKLKLKESACQKEFGPTSKMILAFQQENRLGSTLTGSLTMRIRLPYVTFKNALRSALDEQKWLQKNIGYWKG